MLFPLRTILAAGMTVGFEEAAVTIRLSGAVSISPTAKGRAAVLVYWSMREFAMLATVGCSVTGVTVTVKVVLVLSAPSPAVRVIVTGPPFSLGAGVTITVRLASLPLRTMLAMGTRIGSEEAA